MTSDEMKLLAGTAATLLLAAADDGGDRTLLYGYDVDRRTFHTYQMGGVLHHLVYTDSCHGGDLVLHASGATLAAGDLIPNKRLYPEACDYAFCLRLREAGFHLPFTTYDPTRAAKPFHGLLADRFMGAEPALPGPR